jgi:hypothetical protein
MRDEQLIFEAREHIEYFCKNAGPPDIRADDFLQVRVREAVMIYFGHKSQDARMEICLDRQTGEFIGSTYYPSKNFQAPGADPESPRVEGTE